MIAALVVGASVSAGAPVAAASASRPAFRETTCPAGLFPATVRADCGYVVVPENRAHPDGRDIKVAVAVMRAPAARPRTDPIVFLDGGPSFGAISSFAVDSYFGGASYARNRDVVLVDTRGTGLSRPRLGCPEFDHAAQRSFFSQPFVDSRAVPLNTAAIRACRARLAGKGIDLSAYTTRESAADLDAIRRALGYGRWNVFGLSGDGVLALTYMRLFPHSTRSAVIDSGDSPQQLWNLDYQRGITRELDHIFAGCAANAACERAYPHLRRVFLRVVHRLQVHPADVPFPDIPSHPVVRVDGASFAEDTMQEIFPGNLFAPDTIHGLISEIWRAGHGGVRAVYRERLSGPVPTFDTNEFLAQGKTMSYVCHDLVGFITRADVRRAANALPALAPMFLDPSYNLAWDNVDSPAGCSLWHVGRAARLQHRPVHSSIPTLVLSGEYDTGVPPYVVRQIPPTLRHVFAYRMPASPHIQLANYNVDARCARSIARQFLDAPHRRPDSSCIAGLPRFDFTPTAAGASRTTSRATCRACPRPPSRPRAAGSRTWTG